MRQSAKRFLDASFALMLLLITSPVMLVVATGTVLLSDSGGVIYRATRVGRNGIPFTMYKFRTMRLAEPGASITVSGDHRITRWGAWLRRWKLDELPQLFNVLRGDMSIVGPRPEDPKYVELYSADQRRVLSMRPGMTGPASLAFRHEELILATAANAEEVYVTKIMPTKLAMDLAYVDNQRFSADLRILINTVAALFRRHPDGGCS